MPQNNQDNRICQFVIAAGFMEMPNLLAAAMFGMVVLRAGPVKGTPAIHYRAWHPKFPQTAFNMLSSDGKRPEPPWIELLIGMPSAEGKVQMGWQLLRPPKEILWSLTVDCDAETLEIIQTVTGGEVVGHG